MPEFDAGGARWWVGTSGWIYQHWRGRFYPEGLAQSRWLHHYAGAFDTVELNASFYRLQSERAFQRWRDESPPDFVYAVKASRFITHYRRLAESDAPLALFLERARLLGAKLGPILFQLPPDLRRDDALLAGFLALLPADLRYAVEFRHASWYEPAVYDLLAAREVAFCIHDFAPVESPLVATAPFLYARFHGRRGRYFGEYGAEWLGSWTAQTKDLSAGRREVFVYFNNDAEAQAVRDALALRALLSAQAAA
ncbi:MAG: DUF72 domain-containing protein [Chloroflexota bacterium]